MKDLLKGHNPLMLFFVALMSLFFAFAVRNKIVGEGHTDLNANFFFFMVLASCIGVYFLIHEGIKEFTDFFCKKSWKKRGIVQMNEAVATTPMTSDPCEPEVVTSLQSPEPLAASATETLSKDDIDQMIADAINAKQNIEIEQKDGSVSFRIDMDAISKSFEGDVERARKAVYTEAVMYTREVLAAHMTAEELGILFDRILRYQRSATNEWPIADKEGSFRRLHPFAPIGKFDLLHYGWNLGQLFSKCNAQTVYFLQTTFDQHFDRMQPRIVSKKLTLEPKKGLIKINKDFNPNFRYYSLSAKERNLQDLVNEINEGDPPADSQTTEPDDISKPEATTYLHKDEEIAKNAATLDKGTNQHDVIATDIVPAEKGREEVAMEFDTADDFDEDNCESIESDDNYVSDYDDDFTDEDDEPDEPMTEEEFKAWMQNNIRDAESIEAWKPGDEI